MNKKQVYRYGSSWRKHSKLCHSNSICSFRCNRPRINSKAHCNTCLKGEIWKPTAGQRCLSALPCNSFKSCLIWPAHAAVQGLLGAWALERFRRFNDTYSIRRKMDWAPIILFSLLNSVIIFKIPAARIDKKLPNESRISKWNRQGRSLFTPILIHWNNKYNNKWMNCQEAFPFLKVSFHFREL